jgi:PAS domain S-box-containing protein
MQILDFLISTYETAVQQNLELTEARDELNSLNEKLEEKVEERTADLTAEVAQRKRAEEQLRETSDYLNNLLDYANAPVVVWDPTYHITLFNHAFERLTGHSASSVLNKEVDLLFPPDKREESLANIRRASSGERWETVEIDIQHVDGNVRTLLWNSASLYAPDETTVLATIAQGQDITDRKQAEAQLRQSQKMEAIGTLAGGIAHDFNNMLTGILGNIALMRSTLPSADPLLENLNAAETSARQAADLTKGLLAFSRRAVVLPVPINLTAALDATLTLLKQSLPATMNIVRDYEQTAWNILLDQSHMTQILLNLAVNARDAMKGKGTLTIRARNEAVEEEYVQTNPSARTGEFVHLSVTDTGPGIPPEILEHLFEPFHTTKPAGSGTGLGLSVIYGAVKQASGWITAESTEGAGATFDIYLPRCLEESIQSVTPSPLPVNTGSGTVLVVEDEPIVCAVAQAFLSRSGYTVLTAPDGASALNVLRDHLAGIGLILLDMTMPGMTTGEAVQAIRVLNRTVPILLNSGYTSNDTVKRMLDEGTVQGFLPKPYELHELLGKVQELLHRS